MTVRTVTNLPAVTHGETVRCLFAIELSTMSWVVAFNTPLSEKISRHALTGCKWKRLLELIEEVRARVSRETGRAVEVVSCYEAGYDGFWLHRKLEAHGIRNYVIDPATDAFTHGTSAQRTRWFTIGLKSGQVASCDTLRSEQI